MKKLFYALLFVIGSFSAQSQSLGISKLIYNLQDSVNYFDTTSYYVWVKNESLSNFNNWVFLNATVDTGAGPIVFPNIDSMQMQINAGDSLPFTRTLMYLPGGGFKMGGNIVVIWPSANNFPTADSTRDTTIYIIGTASIFEFGNDKSLKIYPNPCIDNVSIERIGYTNVKRIKIIDSHGRELKEYENVNTVSLQEYDAGLYFIQVEFADRTSRSYRIIKKE